MSKVLAVPTNIITGFLGVGKTSAILNLLKHKPSTERWAVLVNEFGEVGVDGHLIQGSHSQESGVFIREVPGGCMCCASGLPMQIALNQLLTKAQPDRLLIEPTGLGHPKEVLDVLTAKYYRDILLVQKTITLVDARNLSNPRYTEHGIFNQQLEVADIIVANKQGEYQDEDKACLATYLKNRGLSHKVTIFTDQGRFSPDLLVGDCDYIGEQSVSHSHADSDSHTDNHNHEQQGANNINSADIPECGFLHVQNKGEGYTSVGWRFASEVIFDRNALYAWLTGLDVERMKAVFLTREGTFGYNLAAGSLTEMGLDDVDESRIEIIAPQTCADWGAGLLGCRA
ncbi:MAG: cobalamin biosynthesis protein CobW [Alteromonadaceae bacterium]|nr:MAG: cobalamin biosynthesis protein CobW [Alteromonadaceae bacterium]